MKFNKTPEEARKLWVEALRSGQYKQAHHRFASREGYCCLGVACEVFMQHESGLSKPASDTGSIGYRQINGGREYGISLPSLVQNWLGVRTKDGDYCGTSLIEVNDDRADFLKIAEIIETESDLWSKPASCPV